MKRAIALAALLLAASACAQETSNTNTNANANASPAATTPSPSSAQVSLADATAREQQVQDALKRKDWDAFAGHLADDLVYVGDDALYTKADTVEAVKKLDITEMTASDWKLVNVDKDAYVVTCTSTMKGKYDGQDIPGKPVRESTGWVMRGGKWLAVYHQESEIAEPPPAPAQSPGAASSNSNQPASASASPAAASPSSSPGGAATPTDNEKQVWDALKRKDWDAFASHLADDQIEVGPFGVSTKAQSVEMVKQFDFSTATLSDFKETKLTPAVTLLTYTVKATGPGWHPAGEFHTTVWVNRGGKWLAAFHQNTHIRK